MEDRGWFCTVIITPSVSEQHQLMNIERMIRKFQMTVTEWQYLTTFPKQLS